MDTRTAIAKAVTKASAIWAGIRQKPQPTLGGAYSSNYRPSTPLGEGRAELKSRSQLPSITPSMSPDNKFVRIETTNVVGTPIEKP